MRRAWQMAAMVIGVAGMVASARSAPPKAERPAADAEARPRFELVCNLEPATIVLAADEHPGVLAAAKDLQRDVTKITGVTPNIVHALDECGGKCVVLASADRPGGKALLARFGQPLDGLAGQWERFRYRVVNDVGGKQQVLLVAGSDFRGTIFGLYDFEQKHLEVDPLWFWCDHEPPTRGELIFDSRIDYGPSPTPTWKYRGWTLNDHPQMIEWMESGLVQRARYARYMFAIHSDVIERLCEAALRLKMNMFTWYFIDVAWQPDHERLRQVADRGLFLTQHQMESVGADSGFWDEYWANHNPAGKPREFSYRRHPEAFREFWSYYIRRWSEFSPQVVWELNLRGWADGPYREPSLPDGGSEQERSAILSEAIADQARLIRQLDPNRQAEMMTTLYNEVGKNYDQGWIKLPLEVTTGFADAGMHGMSYSKKFWTEPRDPRRKYGQYFHTQYFGGGPQIAKCTPVEEYIKVNLDAMYQRGDTHHMLLAMNELRHQQIEIRAIAEMLWNYPAFRPREYLLRYCREQFGEAMAEKTLALYDEYYQKYPHKTVDDGFKKYPSYYKVMEPLFTVIGNLLNIESGSTDGFKLAYGYDKKIYEQGVRDLGQVLEHAEALRPAIPANRRQFFDYEFLDAVRQVRGIYQLSIDTQEAIDRLKAGDRAGALAQLEAARPLVEAMYAGFQNSMAGEKWRYWYRNGTNRDFYLAYNLYRKAKLRLQVESFDFVTGIEPQRHPYLGNVVLHRPAQVGDQIYSSQAERLNSSVFNGAPFSIVASTLPNAFQIGGVQTVYEKWKQPVADYGLGYQFTLRGRAKVIVAKEKKQSLKWLAEAGFQPLQGALEVGYWGWPYRYRNRPPQRIYQFELYAKDFPAGAVTLGPNVAEGKGIPYIVFVQPSLLLFENFRQPADTAPPRSWQVKPAGSASLVAYPEYDGEMRPTVFDLSTVNRYRPLGLCGLRLDSSPPRTAPPAAEIALAQPAQGNCTFHARVRPSHSDSAGGVWLVGQGKPALGVVFAKGGKIALQAGDGRTTPIGDYRPGQWYNLELRLRPHRGEVDVTIEDERLGRTERKQLPLGSLPGDGLAAVRLEGAAQGGHFEVMALDGWLE